MPINFAKLRRSTRAQQLLRWPTVEQTSRKSSRSTLHLREVSLSVSGPGRPFFHSAPIAAKFRRPMFNRSKIIVLRNKLTNKQTETPLKTSTSLRYATPVGKYWSKMMLHLPSKRSTRRPCPVKAEFHYVILVADRSETGGRPASSLLTS